LENLASFKVNDKSLIEFLSKLLIVAIVSLSVSESWSYTSKNSISFRLKFMNLNINEIEFLDVYDQDSETLRETIATISNLLKNSIKDLSLTLNDAKFSKLNDSLSKIIPNISY
jgi:glutathionylspermidine synthase